MKSLKVTRFDGKYFLCEDKENKVFAIEKNEMPSNVNLGDTINISDEGEIEVLKLSSKK